VINYKSSINYKVLGILALLMLSLSILPATLTVTTASSSGYQQLSNTNGNVNRVTSNLPSPILKNVPKVIDSYTITLPTGDNVTVVMFNGSSKPRIALEGTHIHNYKIFESHGHTYVVPLGVDVSKFSPELFDIQVLKTYEITYKMKKLPLIVKMSNKVNVMSMSSVLSSIPSAKGMIYKPLKIINSVAIRAPLNKVGSLFNNLVTSKNVVKVMLDHIRNVSEANPPDLNRRNVKPQLYESVPFIGAPEMWSAGFNGSGVKVAILDTGIDPTNPDLIYPNGTSKVVANRSFVDFNWDGVPDEPVQDMHGHGTHVAGIVGGLGNYLSFIKGVAPGANFIVGKVLSNEGWGYDSWIISGIEWAISEGADIISMSLGGWAYHEYDPLVDAVNQAFNQGVLVVVAAGNSGPSGFTIDSPGVAENALTVGALDTTITPPEIAWFSSVGPAVNGTLKPDVVAPGVDIVSDRARNTYMDMPASYYHVFGSGTSMATQIN
jgi:subtilisin family serine protease